MTTTIHRRSLKPHTAYCGATATPDAPLYLSDTGHPAVVNCPDCVGPSREEQRTMMLASIERTAKHYRDKRGAS